MGDFTGFSFGNWHSSDPESGEVTVLRVSDGDRYKDTLQPDINDKTAEVPGIYGSYYFGSDYGTRTFDIDIAFDHLTETQLRMLRRTFGTKEIKELVFDEHPYKKYMAKLESPIELSYVCFDEPKKYPATEPSDGIRRITRIEQEPVIDEETEEPVIDEETGEPVTEEVIYRDLEQIYPYIQEEGTERIYKGDGTITLICYFPFAKSVYKTLPSVDEEASWAISSGILSAETRAQNNVDTAVDNEIVVYNAGDISTGFKLYIPKTNLGNNFSIEYIYDDSSLAVLNLKQISQWKNNSEVGILIDTDNQLIIGVTDSNTFELSGNLYNEYVSSGFFFKIEPADMDDFNHKLVLTNGTGVQIFYNYLYF